jgi:hypothetical protein
MRHDTELMACEIRVRHVLFYGGDLSADKIPDPAGLPAGAEKRNHSG